MKRWIIRSFFIGLLLLCVGGWGCSRFYSTHVDFSNRGWIGWLVSQNGLVAVNSESDSDDDPSFHARIAGVGIKDGTFWPAREHVLGAIGESDATGQVRAYLGFGLSHPRGGIWAVAIPYWFLTFVSIALLWLVWRKTRPKPVGRAFPVEVKQLEGSKP